MSFSFWQIWRKVEPLGVSSSNVVNTEGGQHTELSSLQYTVCFDPLTQYDALKTL